MKSILIIILCLLNLSAYAGELIHVNGYYRADGTWVRGHVRTPPNDTITDNLSYRGTGSAGSRIRGRAMHVRDDCYGLSDYECTELALSRMPAPRAVLYRNSATVVTNSTVELMCMPNPENQESEVLPRNKALMMSLYLRHGTEEHVRPSHNSYVVEFTMRDGTTRFTENVFVERLRLRDGDHIVASLANFYRVESTHNRTEGTPPVEDIISVLLRASKVSVKLRNVKYVYSLTGITRDVRTLLASCPDS